MSNMQRRVPSSQIGMGSSLNTTMLLLLSNQYQNPPSLPPYNQDSLHTSTHLVDLTPQPVSNPLDILIVGAIDLYSPSINVVHPSIHLYRWHLGLGDTQFRYKFAIYPCTSDYTYYALIFNIIGHFWGCRLGSCLPADSVTILLGQRFRQRVHHHLEKDANAFSDATQDSFSGNTDMN